MAGHRPVAAVLHHLDEETYDEPAPYAEEPWVEQDHTDHYDGCVDQQDHHGEEIDDEILALELRTVADIDAEAPHDIGDETVSDVVQSQTIACMAWFTTRQSKGKKKERAKAKENDFLLESQTCPWKNGSESWQP